MQLHQINIKKVTITFLQEFGKIKQFKTSVQNISSGFITTTWFIVQANAVQYDCIIHW